MRTSWGSAAALRVGVVHAALALGCGGAPASEPEASLASPIVGGALSDTQDDSVVLIYDATASFECTGTIIAPTLVLTARHCVSDVLGDALQCDESGHAVAGGQLGDDLPAGDLSVFVGSARNKDFPAASAKGIATFHDDAVNICDHDLAVIQVDKMLAAPVAKLRLAGTAIQGEAFTVIGWGATEVDEITAIRQRRTGVGLLAIGPTSYAGLAVPPNDFLLGESLCSGDSGGPAISAFSGAVVGVASYGGNGTTPVKNDPASTCVDKGNGVVNTFTSLAPFKNVIDAAMAAAGATAQIDDAAPPAPAPAKSGCAASPGAPPVNGGALIGVATVAALLRRRRRGPAPRSR